MISSIAVFASAITAVESILNASNEETFIESILTSGFWKPHFEAVVKSVSLVPTAIIRSACFAAALAAGPPVTPIPPRLSGRSQRILPLPA